MLADEISDVRSLCLGSASDGRYRHVSWENLSWVVRIKDVFSIALAVISWAADPFYVWLLP